jgi:hypothetical protein
MGIHEHNPTPVTAEIDFIREMDMRAARENRDLAQAYLSNARMMEPDKYPNEREHRNYFVRQAREIWHRYLRDRKAAMQ